MTKGLNPRQLKFVQEYSKTANGTEAARRAGYSAKSENHLAAAASGLLRNRKVREALNKLTARAEKATIASREERLEILTQFARSPTEETKDRIKASEVIAKMQGDYLTKHEHSGPGGAPIQVESVTMPPDEAARLLAELHDRRERR